MQCLQIQSIAFGPESIFPMSTSSVTVVSATIRLSCIHFIEGQANNLQLLSHRWQCGPRLNAAANMLPQRILDST
ncbi:hypothetical protein M378DRAFT_361984 [Amanita muscaria Koide BX008]|uniref:Uncharacterized protein n=1 Tax=Amanita muscaria (strain Koide BX008) TaxID=946122 RepID=A0A0C2S4Y9_AMAMK|nr:hypothetical protein M378DRAFT_361984 [Amanita muscaria Koide BX008]